MCKRNIGVAQELGRSCQLHITHRDGVAVNSNLQADKPRIQLAGAKRVHVVVSPSEGNEATRNGWQEGIVS